VSCPRFDPNTQSVLRCVAGSTQRTRWKAEWSAGHAKTKRDFGCPVEFSIDLLSGKWKTVILSRLNSPMRYGELRRTFRR